MESTVEIQEDYEFMEQWDIMNEVEIAEAIRATGTTRATETPGATETTVDTETIGTTEVAEETRVTGTIEATQANKATGATESTKATTGTTKSNENPNNTPQIVQIKCMHSEMHNVPMEIAMQMDTLKHDILEILKKDKFVDSEMIIIINEKIDQMGVKLCSEWVINKMNAEKINELESEFHEINRQNQSIILLPANALNMFNSSAAAITLYRREFINEHSSDDSDCSEDLLNVSEGLSNDFDSASDVNPFCNAYEFVPCNTFSFTQTITMYICSATSLLIMCSFVLLLNCFIQLN